MARVQKILGFYVLALLPLAGCATLPTLPPHRYVEFLPCIGYPAGQDGSYTVAVRGLVYQKSWLNRLEPEILDFMEVKERIPDPEERAAFEKRFGMLLDDHPAGVRVALMGGGGSFVLAKSDRDGHIRCEITLTRPQIEAMGVTDLDKAAKVSLRVYTARGDHRDFVCFVYLLPNQGISVISDIDDTIRVTDVNNTKRMLRHTLVDPFNPIPGMPEMYTAWAGQGASFHYLSASPKDLLGTVMELTDRTKCPDGSFHLRPIAWGQSHFKAIMTMLEAPPEFKIDECCNIIEALPNRRYVLVGDTAQHDPEVYGEIARRYPQQVARILIRNVTCAERNEARFDEAFRDVPASKWRLYKGPAEVQETLAAMKAGVPWHDGETGTLARQFCDY